MPDVAPKPSPRVRLAFRTLAALSWSWLVGVAVFAGLLFVGERWWVGTVALYLPRQALFAPLLFLAPLALSRAHRRLFALQVVAGGVVALALCGPHLSRAHPPSGGPSLRVVSYNVWYGKRGMAAIENDLDTAHGDVVVIQALSPSVDAALRARFGPAMKIEATGEFLVASAFPIVEIGDGARFLRCTLETPLGLIDLYAVHPASPRAGLAEVHHQSKKRLLTHGPSEEAIGDLVANTERREREVAEVARDAAARTHPVIIAGDHNLPEGSAIYRAHLGRFQDGFAEVGNGFGYTFPTNLAVPWMRIDRILAGPELRFTSFRMGGLAGSDHRAVWADLERR